MHSDPIRAVYAMSNEYLTESVLFCEPALTLVVPSVAVKVKFTLPVKG